MPWGSCTFWLPRRGNTPGEYEDAFALDEASGRYAVADGATEGCFTGLWARLLVKDFVAGAECEASLWTSSLPAVQERWDTDVRSRDLDWDAEHWVEQGASAAFLGVMLTTSPQGTRQWRAVAVGDTCLFHTRGSILLRAFPLDRSGQFNNRPRLVGSRMPLGEVHKRQRHWSDGCGQPGDRLWAMTDALAKWCLVEHEAGSDPWRELESLLDSPQTQDHFADWIEGLRGSGRLLNDDVTVLAIRL
jgi:hypothetical protein